MLIEFHKHSGAKDGYQPRCKKCALEVANEWYAIPENREKRLTYVRKWSEKNHDKMAQYKRKARVGKYGLTLDGYNELLKLQGGVCAICGSEKPGRGDENFPIDHDHKTGKVRGLLCHHCNQALAFLKDSVTSLKSAIKYLGGEV